MPAKTSGTTAKTSSSLESATFFTLGLDLTTASRLFAAERHVDRPNGGEYYVVELEAVLLEAWENFAAREGRNPVCVVEGIAVYSEKGFPADELTFITKEVASLATRWGTEATSSPVTTPGCAFRLFYYPGKVDKLLELHYGFIADFVRQGRQDAVSSQALMPLPAQESAMVALNKLLAILEQDRQPSEKQLVAGLRSLYKRVQQALAPVVITLEQVMQQLGGIEFENLHSNQQLATAVQELLSATGTRLRCPRCGEPSILICHPVGGSKQGRFQVRHLGERVAHFASKGFPKGVRLCPAPPDPRRRAVLGRNP